MAVAFPTHLKPVSFPDDVRRANMAETLARNPNGGPNDGDIWIFGYGSLMWDPRFEPAETRVATLDGHRRSFCFWTTRGRGTPERPGLGLGIVPGGGPIQGLAFRLANDHTRDAVLEALWVREMSSGVYHAPWLELDTEQGSIHGVVYVANEAHQNYAGDMSIEDRAWLMSGARGPNGWCYEYLGAMVEAYERLGLEDPEHVELHERIHAIVRERE
ncbi:MAG: gamma-glutamylcyclotransferase [Rhodospirillaceae bacterium]|jgi:glutathione-specific gamma-glutamylcyclotransferase|nr:gamma-glutamylcyclotransferase [Rhodospirillaceae bacterium]MBT5667477.1 gamma-glutamylcyclotransferase [Rhodospirillaceae bacterium]MBT5809869.1 gamma-glutamylcyclotransferase [Rhodospirillaceae bacterium]